MKIQTVLSSKGMHVHTIRAGQLVREAVHLLTRHNIGALVVVDGEGGLAGMVSERDIVRALARSEAMRLCRSVLSE